MKFWFTFLTRRIAFLLAGFAATGVGLHAQTVSTYASGFNGPSALAFDAAGNLYVANFGNNTVSKVTPGGSVSTFASSNLNYPCELAFDTAGNLYVANFLEGTVSKVTSGGSVSTFASGFNKPVGLAFDATGNLYVANRGSGTVSKVTPGGSVTDFASGLSSPYALAFDKAGNLYVGSGSAATVSKIPSGGGSATTFVTAPAPAASVDAMAFDAAGNLYLVSRKEGGILSKATPDGGSITTLTLGLNYLYALAIDAAGNLFVASDTGTVVYKVTLPTPTITSLSPTSGRTAGGTSVVITGTNFTNVTAVKFGATAALGYTVNSATQITAISPGPSAGTVHITVTNAEGTSATGAASQFTFVNAAPVIANLNGDSVSYTENGSAVQLDLLGNATVSSDATDFEGGNVTVTIASGGSSEHLGISSTSTIKLAGSTLSVGVTPIGMTPVGNTGQGGTPLRVNLYRAATIEVVNALLQAITYVNTSDTPPASRTVSVTFNDGHVGTSAPANVTVAITAVNDAPSSSGLPTDVTVVEATASDFNLSAVTLADPDAGAGSMTLTLTASAGTLAATSGGGVTVTGAGSGTLTLAGPLASLNTFLDTAANIKYTGAANVRGDNAATVTVKLRDAAALETTLGTVNVDITALNAAPTLGAIGDPAAILEDAGQQTIALSGISAGPDETQTLTVTASSNNPGLIPNPTVTYTSPNATGSLSYTPVANANGSAVITVTVTDDGGGSATFSRTFTVNVTPVNDAPTNIALSSATLNQSAGVNAVVGTLSATDVDVTDIFTFTLVAGTGDTDNALFQISGTSLQAKNPANVAVGNRSVRVQASDGNGGTFAKSFTIAVTDDLAPGAPSRPDLAAAGDTGVSSSDNITSNTTPTFTGTAEVGSTVTLYDTDGTTVLGTGTATGGSWSITAPELAAGSHTVTAKAKDAANNVSAASDGLAITIDTTGPTVSSVSVPANGTYPTGQNLNFTVNWSEAVAVDTTGGIPSLAVTVGATTRQAAYVSGSGSSALVFRYTTQSGDADADGVTVGALALNSGTITDAAGNPATVTLNSVGSTAAVLIDTEAPTVTGRTVPANGTYKTGAQLEFTVTYSENVTVTGTPAISVTLATGGTVSAAYAGGTGTTTLTFRYTVASGNLDADGIEAASSITLNGGTIKDGTGNDAATTNLGFAATTGVLVDGVAPTVSSGNRQTPAGASTNATSVVYRVTFAEAVTGVDTADFTLTKTGTADGAIASINAVSGTVYDVTVNTVSGNGTLRLDLNNAGTGIADTPGNAIATGYTAGQTYTIDNTVPTLSTIARQTPATVHTDAASVTWRVTFAEAVTGVDATDFAVTQVSGTAAGTIASVTAVSASVYDVAVTPSGRGQLRLDIKATGTGIADVAGNAMADGGYTTGDFYVVGVTSVIDTLNRTGIGVAPANSAQSYKVAQRFTTAAGQPLTLSSVVARLDTVTGTPAPVVRIYTNNAGAPGTAVGTALTNPASLTANALNVWTGSVTLNASTTYWIVFEETASAYKVAVCPTTFGETGSWLTNDDYKLCYLTMSNTPGLLLIAAGASGTPAITSSLTANGTVGLAFSYSITATNTPTSYAATGLPPGLSLNTTTGAITGTPTQAGTFNIVLTGTNGSGAGPGSTLVLTIGKASATVTLGSLTQTYTGTPRAVTATTSPSGLAVNFLYNGLSTAPTAVGTYPVDARINDPDYVGAISGTLTIMPATARVTLICSSCVYDGTAKCATVTTTPAGLPVTVTYDGSATAPMAAGSYTVVATINSANYTGSGTGTLVIAPAVVAPVVPSAGGTTRISAADSGLASGGHWQRNGTDLANATGLTLTLPDMQPPVAGLYTYTATAPGGGLATSEPVIVGLTTMDKVIGTGEQVGADIVHPNGNVYDQVLLEGKGATLTADRAKVTRISFVDLSNDIVQVEFSGAGSLSLVMDDAGTPTPAANYNQPGVDYVRGHAGIVITGANETSNLSVFSVGRANAVNQALFREGVAYDGVANLAFVAIQSTNGRFGGIRTGNVHYFANQGFTGVYAPGVAFAGPVNIGDVSAFDSATPVLVFGAIDKVRIAGGDLHQPNGQTVKVDGITQIHFAEGRTSHNDVLPAQANQAVLEQDGVDVTSLIVENP